jgi:hypothetical protein
MSSTGYRPTRFHGTIADTRLGSCALFIKAKQGFRPGTESSRLLSGR